MNDENGTLDALVQERLEADTEFQTGLEGMEDDAKAEAMTTRADELREEAFVELGKKHTDAEEKAENQKTRAEKAEKKGDKPVEAKPQEEVKESDLSSKDLYALMNAKVPEEDVDEVVRMAKALNISVPDVLKDESLKTVLKTRVEHRATAQAANVRGGKPSIKTSTDAHVVDEANKGNVPEKGSKEAEQLFWAKRGGKKGDS